MKLIIISDTHGHHEELGHLNGDVLIHCGDMENLLDREDHAIATTDSWFGRQQFAHIICTGGNHDLSIERQILAGNQQPFSNATFLNGTEVVIDGVKFFGAPWVPNLEDHAFYADDVTLEQAWSNIPDDVDVLITHVPPAGTLDVSRAGMQLVTCSPEKSGVLS